MRPSVQLSLELDEVPAPPPSITDQLPAEHRVAALVMLAGLIAKAVAPVVLTPFDGQAADD